MYRYVYFYACIHIYGITSMNDIYIYLNIYSILFMKIL